MLLREVLGPEREGGENYTLWSCVVVFVTKWCSDDDTKGSEVGGGGCKARVEEKNAIILVGET